MKETKSTLLPLLDETFRFWEINLAADGGAPGTFDCGTKASNPGMLPTFSARSQLVRISTSDRMTESAPSPADRDVVFST